MKIVLEFESQMELNAYIRNEAREFIAQNTEQQIIVNPDPEDVHLEQPDTKIETFTRRRYWTDMEIQFVKDYYQIKSCRWMAKSLRRKTQDVANMLSRLYKKGLPKKSKRNGKITDED